MHTTTNPQLGLLDSFMTSTVSNDFLEKLDRGLDWKPIEAALHRMYPATTGQAKHFQVECVGREGARGDLTQCVIFAQLPNPPLIHSPADHLPDGGGGGSARVIPGHFGRDWAAEIGNGVVRMKKETQQSQENTENHGGGIFSSREKWGVGVPKRHRNSALSENNRNGLEKSSCKSVEQEENYEKGPCGSWARNQMRNPN
jgi:hypothetical protein